MKPQYAGAISWLLITQVAAAPAHMDGRDPSVTLFIGNSDVSTSVFSSAQSSPSATEPLSTPITNGLVSSLYYSNTGELDPDQLPIANISRILYAFGSVSSDGTVSAGNTDIDLEAKVGTDLPDAAGTINVYGRVRQINLVKRANRHIKVLLSLGGSGASENLALAASTEASREQFATTAVQLVTDWGFDGVDIDWEFVTTEADRANVVLLLKATRQAFDDYATQNAPGYHFLITYACPAGAQNYQLLDMARMDPYIDTWNLMAYDYSGSWSEAATFHSNLYGEPAVDTAISTDDVIAYYLSQGIAPAKLHMGLPLYGHVFEGTQGLGYPFSGVGPGEDGQAGFWIYKDLPKAGAVESTDTTAVAAWSYDSTTKELIAYDSPESAQLKANYIQEKGLGGAFFWEANQDHTDSRSLVCVVAESFSSLDSALNLIDYPTSKYDNIRMSAQSG